MVAGRKIERDDPGDAGAVGIDGDGIDGRTGRHIGGPHRRCGKRRNHDEAGRHKTIGNQSHWFPSPKGRLLDGDAKKSHHPW